LALFIISIFFVWLLYVYTVLGLYLVSYNMRTRFSIVCVEAVYVSK
jgi:hypothetical protein